MHVALSVGFSSGNGGGAKSAVRGALDGVESDCLNTLLAVGRSARFFHRFHLVYGYFQAKFTQHTTYRTSLHPVSVTFCCDFVDQWEPELCT